MDRLVSGNYISGNQVSVSSLCPGMRPTTTTMSTTSELTSAASTINTQVSQIWEEKQRISLSRERKAARVLGIVMGQSISPPVGQLGILCPLSMISPSMSIQSLVDSYSDSLQQHVTHTHTMSNSFVSIHHH